MNLVQESLPTKYFPMNGTGGKGCLYLHSAPQKLQIDFMEIHSGVQACGGRNGNGAATKQIEAKRFGTLTAEVTKVRAGVDMTDDAMATSRAVDDDFHPGITSAGGWIELKGNRMCVRDWSWHAALKAHVKGLARFGDPEYEGYRNAFGNGLVYDLGAGRAVSHYS